MLSSLFPITLVGLIASVVLFESVWISDDGYYTITAVSYTHLTLPTIYSV